ncbi:hypothetical protein OG21DRAFT_632218 [Imleria badia]|nr:hypothetical protein OG21DRAFT_632218 [Imleria badia]
MTVRSLTYAPSVHHLDCTNLYAISSLLCIPVLNTTLGASAITIHIRTILPIGLTSFSPITMLLWALITALNLCVAIPICIRLYIAQKRTHTILSSSPYKSIAIVLVECGALVTACSVAMMILYACNYIYALVSIGIATQIAVRLFHLGQVPWIDRSIHRLRLSSSLPRDMGC